MGGRTSSRGSALLSAVLDGSPLGRTVCGAWMQSRPLTALGLAVLGAGAACSARDVVTLRRVAPDRRITAYKAPQYWLDYRHGFVRRGFPGAVLSALTGGAPTLRQVTTTGVGLSLSAAAAVVPLAVRVARQAPDDAASLLVAGTVLTSPLTVSLLLHDIGRFDGLGVLALSALSSPGPAWERVPCWVGAPALAGVLAIAAATQEFMVAPLAPVTLMRASSLAARCGLDPAGTALLFAGILAPAAAITVASAVMTPPAAAAQAARRRARSQGVAPPDELGDALSAVERNLIENRAFFGHFEPGALSRGVLLWVGVFGLTVVALSQLLDRATSWRYWRQVAYHAAVGALLSVLGADFRRWWGLSLLGVLAELGAAPAREDGAPEAFPRRASRLRSAGLAVAVLAAANVRLRRRVVSPTRRSNGAPGRS
jgi:hypothetical protein